jgi:hypothetical protein
MNIAPLINPYAGLNLSLKDYSKKYRMIPSLSPLE